MRFWSSRGPREAHQLACADESGIRHLGPAQEPGDLAHLLVERKPAHARRGPGTTFLLFYGEMSVRQSGDLWKVRDSNDLVKIREVFQALPDRLGHAPADADIDLVEYQDGEPVRFGQYALEREHDAGDFPPGGDPDEGLLLFPQVCGDEE